MSLNKKNNDKNNKNSKSKFYKKVYDNIESSDKLKEDQSKNPINNELFFEEYFVKPKEKMDFYDAYKYDKRTFCELYHDYIYDKVFTLNTFLVSEHFKPLSIKIVIYILYITLYFIINGFFFSEEYISKVYHLKKKRYIFFFCSKIN